MRRRALLVAGGALLGLRAQGQGIVRPGVPIVLPRDFGAHPEFRTEWWYVTGWLAAKPPAAASPRGGAAGPGGPAPNSMCPARRRPTASS